MNHNDIHYRQIHLHQYYQHSTRRQLPRLLAHSHINIISSAVNIICCSIVQIIHLPRLRLTQLSIVTSSTVSLSLDFSLSSSSSAVALFNHHQSTTANDDDVIYDTPHHWRWWMWMRRWRWWNGSTATLLRLTTHSPILIHHRHRNTQIPLPHPPPPSW